MRGLASARGRGPRRAVVALYGSYGEAEGAVSYLSDEGFPVERATIAAQDLRMVEQVTGWRGYGQATLQGAGSRTRPTASMEGRSRALFGFFLGLFSLIDPLGSALLVALYGLVLGAILRATLGLVSHAATGGQRDFSSVAEVEAGRYNVVADEGSQKKLPGCSRGWESRSRAIRGSRTFESTVARDRALPGCVLVAWGRPYPKAVTRAWPGSCSGSSSRGRRISNESFGAPSVCGWSIPRKGLALGEWVAKRW